MSSGEVFDLGELGVEPAPVTPGEEIRRARELMGLTQDDLAERLNVASSTIWNWENDKTTPRSKMAAIRKVLNMDEADAQDHGPPLRKASDAELIGEIARRLERLTVDAAGAGTVPTDSYKWPKRATPSRRRLHRTDETEEQTEHRM